MAKESVLAFQLPLSLQKRWISQLRKYLFIDRQTLPKPNKTMKKNIVIIGLSIICLVLAGNIYNLHKRNASTNVDELKGLTDELNNLKAEKESWGQRENDLLRQNGECVTELNELKFITEKKPQTIKIYRYEKKHNVDESASNEYNGILSRRYESKLGE